MDYLKPYKSFISSHFLSEGIRMTAGILLPAFVLLYFDLLSVGIVVSVGALSVSIPDTAGPILHRRNAMIACNAAVFLVALLTGWALHSALLLGITIFSFSFLFSMLGVYGTRASAVGTAALLVMILNLSEQRTGEAIVWHAIYILAGGLWYMLFSLLLYRIRPNKLMQQVIGDWLQTMADYLRTRASFYRKAPDYDAIYNDLLRQQVVAQEKQDLVNELLFKTPHIVQQSSHTGRILVMIYLDAADLFERLMTSYQDYSILHRYFDNTGMLEKFNALALQLAEALDDVGLALKIGRASPQNEELTRQLAGTTEYFESLRAENMKADNLEGFITLRRILDHVTDIAERIRTLNRYTTFDRSLQKRSKARLELVGLATHQEISLDHFVDNLSLSSNIFRHSLRVAIAVITGFIISLFFDLGHSYWIMLTIIVILKPAYSLTKKRNLDRLTGTICGLVIGILVIYFVKNSTALLVIMIALMAGTYSFIRKHYLVSVMLMTPYIILFLHLLHPGEFRRVIEDRLIDTAIGSVIAFVSNLFLVPGWERKGIRAFMIRMLQDGQRYFCITAEVLTGKRTSDANEHQLARKDALVALANLSDAFNRMLSEPKRARQGIEQIKKFVVLSHRLTSHVATLSYYRQLRDVPDAVSQFGSAVSYISDYFTQSISLLEHKSAELTLREEKDMLVNVNQHIELLLQERGKELEEGRLETGTRKALSGLKSITDQFNFIYKIMVDVYRISGNLHLE